MKIAALEFSNSQLFHFRPFPLLMKLQWTSDNSTENGVIRDLTHEAPLT